MIWLVAALGPAASAWSAVVGIEMNLLPGQTLMGRSCYVRIKVKNAGFTTVNAVSATLLVQAGTGSVKFIKADGSVVSPMSAGAESTVTYEFVALTAGSVGLVANVKGIEAGTGTAVNVSSAAATLLIGDSSVNAPRNGSFRIRNNILRASKTSYRPPTGMMYLVVNGPPGGVVRFAIHGVSGEVVTEVHHELPGGIGGKASEYTIGADGTVVVPYDAVGDNGILPTGTYWMVASGAINGRQPFMVIKQP